MKMNRREFLKAAGITGLSAAALATLCACGAKETSASTTAPTDAQITGPATAPTDPPVTAHPDDWDFMAEGCFRPSYPANVDEIPTGFTTSKDELIIRMAQDEGSMDPLSGGLYVTPACIFNLCGTSMLAAGYVDGGIDMQINKYSACDSMTWDDDHMGVTFHIRKGAHFHNGDPVTSADLAFSVRRLSSNARFSYINFENITCVDDDTLYIPMTRQDGNFLFIMGIFVHIFSEKVYNEYVEKGKEADFFYCSEGTCGMYEITEWVSGDHVTLKADHTHYLVPTIETVTVRFIADNTVAMMELETGGIDLLYGPSTPDIQNVLAGRYGDAISGVENAGDVMTLLGMNIAGKFSDLNLRYAVTHAVDWKTVIKAAWGVMGSEPTTILASTLYGLENTSDWWQSMYDVEKAKECLANSAYADGVKLSLIIGNGANVVAASEMLKNYLNKVGIDLDIQTYDVATQSDIIGKNDGWDLWIRDFGGYGMTWGSNFIEGGTYHKICHFDVTEPDNAKELFDLGIQLSSTLDHDTFAAVAKKIQSGYLEGKFFYFFPITQAKIVTLGTAELHNWFRTKDNLYIADSYFE